MDHPHLIPVMDQSRLPGTQPTQGELMDRLLCAIASKDRFRVYDIADQLMDPNDLPTRQDLYKTRLGLLDATH